MSDEWKGEFLPPVGSVQLVEEDYRQVIVLAHGISLGEQVALCQDGDRILMALPKAFRTAEQIAAKKREKAIDEMVYGVCGADRNGSNTTAFILCALLYDAGYRKVEGGAA